MMKKLIKLIDGRELTVYPNDAQKTDGTAEDKFGLDTTGQYLTLGGQRPKERSLTLLERGLSAFNCRLFVENAWFLLKNADEILSDSRMFFAQLDINNHLAYTGTNGFQHPTIGIYVEWWLHYKDVSVTPEGNLIWFIAGSPLSGAHTCSSVKPDGKHKPRSR